MSRRDALHELAHVLDVIGLVEIVDHDNTHALARTVAGDAFLIELDPDVARELVGVKLRQLGGAWSHDEIGVRLGLSAKTVRKHEREALAAARRALGAESN